MILIDYLFLYSVFSIWILLLMNIILTVSGFHYAESVQKRRLNILTDIPRLPTISIMIPAHNEEVVIERTLLSMLELDYPAEKLEIIVINDNSNDRTGERIEKLKTRFPGRNIIHIQTDAITGGKGKSNALNLGFQASTGEMIAVYDADNTPNPLALRYLAYELVTQPGLGATIGKFRTRNKDRNWLTRFINIETLSFQWMAQAGRWSLFRLCTIPGTNFLVRRSILEEIGGWDVKAIAEDTEISFRIYQMGYQISFMPLAITWEEEPETIKVWFRQRTRWVSGNIYVLIKHLGNLFKEGNNRVLFDLLYFFSVYILFLSSIVVSDIVFILGVTTGYHIGISGNFMMVWILSYLIFILQIAIALSVEKGEVTAGNVGLIIIMYFTYCQLWLLVSLKGFGNYIKTQWLRRETKWYKTERFG